MRDTAALAQGLASTLRWASPRRSVSSTALFNVASTGAAGLGGLILARAVGPAVRGEYAAVTAWFGITLAIGSMGQPGALCFYVAREPMRAREYVATSRAMMLATGSLALAIGLLLVPVLAQGDPTVASAYRIAFGASIIGFLGASYTFSLQARHLQRWNRVRVSQPVCSLLATSLLWQLHLLTLNIAMLVLAATTMLQLAWAYSSCRSVGLVPGRAQARLARPLAGYGAAQIAGVAPAALNAQLDKLVLSQTVRPALLGLYAVAVSLSLLPGPLVSAVGYVAFPRLASQTTVTSETIRLQRLAILGSIAISVVTLLPLAAIAYWVVPFVFGPSYRGAVPILWALTPGTIFGLSNGVLGDLLCGRKRPAVVAWAEGLAAVFTVVMLFLLVPEFSVYGAAIASTAAYVIAFTIMAWYLWRRLAPASASKIMPGTDR